MAIEFDCPTCQARIRTPDEAAGKKARCPTCQNIVPIPLASTSPPAGSFGGLGAAPPPLPSASKPPPSISSAAAQANPPPAAMPWLPSSDAFAPKGPPEFTGGVPSYTPPAAISGNPFSDGAANLPGGAVNPYASPGAYASADSFAMSPEEIRGKLLGPAIGIALTAVLGLLSIGGLGLALMLDEEFHRDIQAGGANNPGEVFFAYLILVVVGFLIMVPSLVSLIGAWAMFRGRGLVAAWSGAIATILPCGACWPFSIAFAIWAMVVLSDSRVQTGMK